VAKLKKRKSQESISILTKEGLISLLLIRSSKRRTLVISIDQEALVKVYVPFYVKSAETEKFVKEKAKWIITKVNEANINIRILQKKKYDHESQFLFLGKKYKLEVDERKTASRLLSFDGFGWKITIPENLSNQQRQKHIKEKFVRWYKSQAEEILGGRVFHFSRVMGVEPQKIAIRTQKNLWGSCDHHARSINLNWQLVLSPLMVIDYVIVHELCHLMVPNHSKRFWKKVEEVMPDFSTQKRWLKTHSLDMVLP